MMTVLSLFLILPSAGFVLSLLLQGKREGLYSTTAIVTTSAQNLLLIAFTAYWVWLGAEPLNSKEFVLFSTHGYEFFLDLYFDEITAVFMIVGSVLATLISLYSKHYLHREAGFKRYFNTILFFYLGYNIIILSGNFETLFFGWEVLGLSSFLLIAFYRDRYLPVRNAFKVFSIYRISDIALILTMWMSHHLWHHNIIFLELGSESFQAAMQQHAGMGLFISLMLLISASVKSAQLPFSSWLPRAMEGPTPSSAIFYGSLSVHIGVFLLLRTAPIWSQYELFRWLLAILGLATGIVATVIGQVQSSVKSQIAYSSVAQIGLIFIEVALGLQILALIHFTGNAFLRTYQLLVSPSTVAYLIREQCYVLPPARAKRSTFVQKVMNTVYVLGIKEANLDTYQYRLMWAPFKKMGKLVSRLDTKVTVIVLVLIYLAGSIWLASDFISSELSGYSSLLAALIGLLVVSRAFVERVNPSRSLLLVAFGHLWVALAVSFNEEFSLSDTAIYLSGVLVSLVLGLWVLTYMKSKEQRVDLNAFYGHIYEHKWKAFIFLMACLGMAGFPVTPTFIGADLIFGHIHENQAILTILISFTLIISGLSAIRMYIRIFLGPHVKTYHPVAQRSA